MAEDNRNRAAYLRLMYEGLDSKVNSYAGNINAVGDTSFDTAQLQMLRTNQAFNQAQRDVASSEQRPQDQANWWERTMQTIGALRDNLITGFLGFFDGIYDWGNQALAGMGIISQEQADANANFDWQAYVTKYSQTMWSSPYAMFDPRVYSELGELWNDMQSGDTTRARAAADYTQQMSWASDWGGTGQFIRGVEQSIGQMLPSIVVGGFFPNGTIAQQAAALGTEGVGVFARSASENYAEHGDWGKANLQGLLSGAVETISEIVVGPMLSKATGMTSHVGGVFAQSIGKKSAEAVGKAIPTSFIKQMGHTFLEEGLEEVFSGVFDPLISSIGDNGQSLSKYGDKDFWLGTNLDSILMQGLAGGVAGVVMGAPTTAMSIKQYSAYGEPTMQAREDFMKAREEYLADRNNQEKADKLAEASMTYAAYLKALNENATPEQIRNVTAGFTSAQAYLNQNVNATLTDYAEKFAKDTEAANIKSGDMDAILERDALRDWVGDANGEINILKAGDERLKNANGGFDNANISFNEDGTLKALNISKSLMENGDFAAVLGHEVGIHLLLENASKADLSKYYNRIKNTGFWNDAPNGWDYNGKQLYDEYLKRYQQEGRADAETKAKGEVVANYFEAMLRSENESKTFSKLNDLLMKESFFNTVKNALARRSFNMDRRITAQLAKDIRKAADAYDDVMAKRYARVYDKIVVEGKDEKQLTAAERLVYRELQGALASIDKGAQSEVDADGNDLSKGQIKFFKDSKIRDDEGNLIPLYHGSNSAGFTSFFGDVIFLTDEFDRAASYTRSDRLVVTRKFKTADELIDWFYENEQEEMPTGGNSFDMGRLKDDGRAQEYLRDKIERIRRWGEQTDSEKTKEACAAMLKNYESLFSSDAYFVSEFYAEDEDLEFEFFENEETFLKDALKYIQTEQNVAAEYKTSKDYDDWGDEDEDYSPQAKTNNVYALYANIKNPLTINCRGRNFMGVPYKGGEFKTDEVAKMVKEEGKYDGVIFENIKDNGARDMFDDLGRGTVYVAFSSNQLKAMDNLNPTEDEDIRYSIDKKKTETDYFDSITEKYGKQLTEGSPLSEANDDVLKALDEQIAGEYNIEAQLDDFYEADVTRAKNGSPLSRYDSTLPDYKGDYPLTSTILAGVVFENNDIADYDDPESGAYFAYKKMQDKYAPILTEMLNDMANSLDDAQGERIPASEFARAYSTYRFVTSDKWQEFLGDAESAYNEKFGNMDEWYDELGYNAESFASSFDDYIASLPDAEGKIGAAKYSDKKGTYATVAPFYSERADLSNIQNIKGKVEKGFLASAQNLAKDLSLSISETLDNLGSWEGGGELSYTWGFKADAPLEAVGMFAQLQSDLNGEVQDAVIYGQYLPADFEGEYSLEYRIKATDITKAHEILLANGFDDNTITLSDGVVKLFDDDSDGFEKRTADCIQKMIDAGIYGGEYEKSKCQTFFRNPFDRRSSYQKRLSADEVGRPKWDLVRNDAYEKALKNVEDFLEKTFLTFKSEEDFLSYCRKKFLMDGSKPEAAVLEYKEKFLKEHNASSFEELSSKSQGKELEKPKKAAKQEKTEKGKKQAKPKVADSLVAVEDDMAAAIKAAADNRLDPDAVVIAANEAAEALNELEGYIRETTKTEYSIPDSPTKARRLFEDLNVLQDNKQAIAEKFVRSIVEDNRSNGGTLFDEFAKSKSMTVEQYNAKKESLVEEYTSQLLKAIALKGKETKANKVVASLLLQLRSYSKSGALSNSIRSAMNAISKEVFKSGNTGQYHISESKHSLVDSFLKVFRTKANGAAYSNSNMARFADFNMKGLVDYLAKDALDLDTDFVVEGSDGSLVNGRDLIIELTDSLKSSYDPKAEIMTAEQEETAATIVRLVKRLYMEAKGSEMVKAKAQAKIIQDRIAEVNSRRKFSKTKIGRWFTRLVLDYTSPDVFFSYLFGGRDNAAYKLVWDDLMVKPYYAQLTKQRQYYTEFDALAKVIAKHGYDRIEVKTENGQTIKIEKNALYSFALNQMSPDNNVRLSNPKTKISYTEKGFAKVTHELSYATLDEAVKQNVKEDEMKELKAIFDWYNGSMQEYTKSVMEKNIGFSSLRDGYYPIVASEAHRNTNFTEGDALGGIGANVLMNNRMKGLTNRMTNIEINVNPLFLGHNYIDKMTSSGEIGKASVLYNRLFRIKNEGKSAIVLASNGMVPNAKDYIGYAFNALIGNRQANAPDASFLSKLASRFATVQLGLNIRSSFKQTCSLFTAVQQVGMKAWFRGLMRNTGFKNFFSKARANAIASENPVFWNRTYNAGFSRAITLASPGQFTHGVSKRIADFSMKFVEGMDRFVCYTTYGMAEEYAKLQGLKEGTQEYKDMVNETFSQIIMNTQSNSDRIMMSRTRSGALGNIVKVLFGTFQSDAQNKASLCAKAILDYQSAKADGNDALLAKSKKSIGVFAAGVVASGLLAMLIDRLVDLIQDKKEWQELGITGDNWHKILFEGFENTALQWIPFVGTISDWFQYGSVSYLPLEPLDNLAEVASGFFDGQPISKAKMMKFIKAATDVFGLPATNFEKLVNGVIQDIPYAKLQFRNLLYGVSEGYLSNEVSNRIAKRNYDRAGEANALLYSLYKAPVSDAFAREVVRLKTAGASPSTRNIPSAIGDTALTDEQKAAFKEAYYGLGESASRLMASKFYVGLSDEQKASAITKLSSAYFDYASAKALGKEPSGRLAMLLAEGVSIDEFIAIISSVPKDAKKDDVIKALNAIKGKSGNERILIAWLMGYQPADKSRLRNALVNAGVSAKSAKAATE